MKITDQLLQRGWRGKPYFVQSWDCGYVFRKHHITNPEAYFAEQDELFKTFMRGRTKHDFERLESKECLAEYLQDLTTDRDSIVLVLDDQINGALF